ncbi:hypothetical protein AAGW23_11060 [Stutzerimonas chloritidismutans]|uniref:Uncharacterized protein n=2 Tax=Stutzerimonas stutzeri subgroup TaxID=578833 RepID=A0A5S5BEH9_STUST|nr:hypothetical protein A9A72_122592 [Stutzerimonas stutzeri]
MSTLIYIACVLVYFLFCFSIKGKFGGVTFLYICISVYFLPVLTGSVVDWNLVFARSGYAVPTAADMAPVSWYLSFLYIYITGLAIFFEFVLGRKSAFNSSYSAMEEKDKYLFFVFFALYFIVFLFLYFHGSLYKHAAAEADQGAALALLTAFSIATIAFGIFSSQKLLIALAVLVALSTLMTGTRTPLAFMMFFLVLKYVYKHGISVNELTKHKKLILLGLIGVFVIYISKYIYSHLNIYGIEGLGILYTGMTSGEYCYTCGFEPAWQMSLFDLARNNIYKLSDIDYHQMLLSWLAVLPIPLFVFDGGSDYVSEYLRSAIFPNAAYSLAGNVLIEALILFGDVGPFLFIFSWFMIVFLLDLSIMHSLKIESKLLFVLCVVLLIYVAFFWNRYMLGSALGHIRNFFYMYVSICFFYALVKHVSRGVNGKQ